MFVLISMRPPSSYVTLMCKPSLHENSKFSLPADAISFTSPTTDKSCRPSTCSNIFVLFLVYQFLFLVSCCLLHHFNAWQHAVRVHRVLLQLENFLRDLTKEHAAFVLVLVGVYKVRAVDVGKLAPHVLVVIVPVHRVDTFGRQSLAALIRQCNGWLNVGLLALCLKRKTLRLLNLLLPFLVVIVAIFVIWAGLLFVVVLEPVDRRGVGLERFFKYLL